METIGPPIITDFTISICTKSHTYKSGSTFRGPKAITGESIIGMPDSMIYSIYTFINANYPKSRCNKYSSPVRCHFSRAKNLVLMCVVRCRIYTAVVMV